MPSVPFGGLALDMRFARCKNRTYILFTETGSATRTLQPNSGIHGPVSRAGVGATGRQGALSRSVCRGFRRSSPATAGAVVGHADGGTAASHVHRQVLAGRTYIGGGAYAADR